MIDNPTLETPSGFPLLTDAAARARLTGSPPRQLGSWEAELIAWLDGASSSLQRATAADVATWLPDDLLVKFDRMSMAHSLEGRAPYLALKVVEAGLALPPSERVNGDLVKVALRRVARRWLPAAIVERPKQGFVLPMARWLGEWFQSQGTVDEYFLERPVPGLDTSELARLTGEDLAAGVRRERLLFAVVLLVEWHHAFRSARSTLAEAYQSVAGTYIDPAAR